MLLRLCCVLLSTQILTPALLFASDFTGQVIGVIDGDTIDILHNGQSERIRLNGIDSPEEGQAFGKAAKQFTSAFVFGKEVTVKTLRMDRHAEQLLTFSCRMEPT